MNPRALFDALHPGPTWVPWGSFLGATYGEPLSEAELAIFQRCTGRETPRPGGYPEAVAIVGVQSGKSITSRIPAILGTLTGERGTHALLVAQDSRSAQRVLYRYAAEPFETLPAFRAEVANSAAGSLELRRGTALSVYPCRPAALRGIRANVVVIDEIAHFVATDGRPTDVEMLRVARGRVATTGGKVIVLSSPYAQSGALYELHRRHYGREDSPTLIWQADAPTMNPTLGADYLARMAEDDPEAFRSEVLGEFRQGISTFLDPDSLAAVVEAGVRERAPVERVRYSAFVDAASGSGKDAFTVAVAHRDGERSVLDCIRAWSPPFNPSGTIAEASALLRRYGIHEAQGDRFAPGFVTEGFRAHGIAYRPAELSTSELYLEALPLVNSRSLVLLDDPALLRELRGLERRRGTAGRDRVDHRPGAHDDRAVAACGALHSVATSERRTASVRYLR